MIDGNKPDEDGIFDEIFDTGRDRGDESVSPEESGQPRDDHGRFAPKQEADAEQQPQAPVEPDPDASPEVDSETTPEGEHIPRSAMIAERKKYQARIAEIEEEAQRREQAYQQQLRQFQQPQQPHEPPDIFDDPDGALAARFAPIQQQMINDRLNMSEDRARDKFGDEVVNQALQAAERSGLAGNFLNSRHPYGDLVSWYQREQTIAEVGTDPKAYRDKLAADIRAEVLAELKSGTAQGQQSQRFPTSLADQTNAGGQQGSVLTEDAIMSEMFRPDRDRRA